MCFSPTTTAGPRQAWDYPWSGAGAHVTGSDSAGILDLGAWKVQSPEWRQRLQQREDNDLLAAIGNRTSTGRPLASDSALSKLEALLNKRLRALPIGRPRKEKGRDGEQGRAGSKVKREKGRNR